MNTYIKFLYALITLLNLSFIPFILYKNFKNKVNRIFSYFIIFIVLYIITVFFYYEPIFSNYIVIIGKINFSAWIFAMYFLFLFSHYFPKEIGKSWYIKILFIESITLALLTLGTKLIVVNEIAIGNDRETIFGPLFFIYIAHFIFYVIASIYTLGKKYFKLKGIAAMQIKYLLTGTIITLIIGTVTNLILPLFGDYSIQLLGPLFSVIFIAFTAFTIVKYRFLDIRVIIKRSFIFAALVLFITSIYSISAFLISNFIQALIGKNSIILSGVITGIIVAIGFEPIKKFLTNATDSFLFKGEYKVDELLSKLSQDFSSTLDLSSILARSSNDLMEALRIKGISVYLNDKEKGSFEERYFAGIHTPAVSISKDEIEGYLKMLQPFGMHNQALVTEELKRLELMKDQEFAGMVARMEGNSVAVTVPLFIKDELIGFYFLDEKKSGDTFSNQDIQVLEIMAGQAATAIENALLYEEQKKFAEKLQIEVDRATKELRSANKELKKLDKAKSEFISIASHQLRTPMTVIKGYVSMIREGDFGPFGEKLNKPLENVLQSTNRLLSLIEDLLNVSRIESGRMQYEFEKTSIQEIVEGVFEDLKNYAKSRKLEFAYHGPKEKLPNIIIDPKKIREVVMNLMDNAIKYTQEGRVDVYLEVNNGEIVYKVVDTGRGMAKDDIGKLFKKFSRVGGAALVHTEGTGLGLYIAKQIIMKHNGKIWAESKGEGFGSTFALALKIDSPRLEAEYEKQVKANEAIEANAAKPVEKEYKEDTIDMSKMPPAEKK